MEELYKIIYDPVKDIFWKLDEQVDCFWQWSKTIKHELEWEASYPQWILVTTIFDELIESTMVALRSAPMKIKLAQNLKKSIIK